MSEKYPRSFNLSPDSARPGVPPETQKGIDNKPSPRGEAPRNYQPLSLKRRILGMSLATFSGLTGADHAYNSYQAARAYEDTQSANGTGVESFERSRSHENNEAYYGSWLVRTATFAGKKHVAEVYRGYIRRAPILPEAIGGRRFSFQSYENRFMDPDFEQRALEEYQSCSAVFREAMRRRQAAREARGESGELSVEEIQEALQVAMSQFAYKAPPVSTTDRGRRIGTGYIIPGSFVDILHHPERGGSSFDLALLGGSLLADAGINDRDIVLRGYVLDGDYPEEGFIGIEHVALGLRRNGVVYDLFAGEQAFPGGVDLPLVEVLNQYRRLAPMQEGYHRYDSLGEYSSPRPEEAVRVTSEIFGLLAGRSLVRQAHEEGGMLFPRVVLPAQSRRVIGMYRLPDTIRRSHPQNTATSPSATPPSGYRIPTTRVARSNDSRTIR